MRGLAGVAAVALLVLVVFHTIASAARDGTIAELAAAYMPRPPFARRRCRADRRRAWRASWRSSSRAFR